MPRFLRWVGPNHDYRNVREVLSTPHRARVSARARRGLRTVNSRQLKVESKSWFDEGFPFDFQLLTLNFQLPPGTWGVKIGSRGRHGFDGSCRDSKACRAPPARNRVEN